MRIPAALALACCLSAPAVSAETFPSHPVRIIVPAAPAGIADLAARVVAERLSAMWGQSVIVENRTGGGGSIGLTTLKNAAPDGYTLLATPNGEIALLPVINPAVKYDVKDFTPLAMLTNNPIVLVANADTPYKTLADVVAAAKKDPASISWATPGTGTWNHLTGEWLWSAAGVKMIHVPYRGGGPASAAVAAGDVSLGVFATSSAQPFLQAGRMRVLAVAAEKKSASSDPSWPTIAESLIPGFNSLQWVGLYAPAGIDPAIRDKISTDVAAVMAEPKIRERFESMSVDPIGTSGAEAAQQLARDGDIARKINAIANIHIE